MKSYRTLALKELLSQKVTSILILIAVVLSTMNSWKWLRKWRMKERFSLSVRRIL